MAIATFAAAAVAAVTGISWGIEQAQGAGSDATSPVPAHFKQTLVNCGDPVVANLPKDAEINTVLDIEHHLLQISYLDTKSGADRVFSVDYEHDVRCGQNPRLSHLVDHVLATWREANAQDCVALRKLHRSGALTDRRGLAIKRDALMKHLDRWCAG